MKRCGRGKNCGATCITRYKLCLLSLGGKFDKVLNKLRDKVISLADKGSLKPKFTSPGQVDAHYNKRIGRLIRSGNGAQAAKLEKERELTKGRIPIVSKFLKDLEKGLPPGAKAVNNGGIINITLITNSKDKVEVSFSPRLGFHFRVNGEVNTGLVKTEVGKVQAALAASSLFRSVAKALPEGSIMKTRARGNDPRLITLYKRARFSDPEPQKGLMFAVKGDNGKMAPASQSQFGSYENDPGSMFFQEGPSGGGGFPNLKSASETG